MQVMVVSVSDNDSDWATLFTHNMNNMLFQAVRLMCMSAYSIFSSSFSFLVRHDDDDEVDDTSCLHAVLSLYTASLNCIFRSSKSSLMFPIHSFACLPWLRFSSNIGLQFPSYNMFVTLHYIT